MSGSASAAASTDTDRVGDDVYAEVEPDSENTTSSSSRERCVGGGEGHLSDASRFCPKCASYTSQTTWCEIPRVLKGPRIVSEVSDPVCLKQPRAVECGISENFPARQWWCAKMVLFKSPHPDLDIPTDITTWHWLFESRTDSPLNNGTTRPLAGYVNAATNERLDWSTVKAKATQLSTVLVNEYGFKPGETVSLFSTNTIWYPVAMFAAIRFGGRVNGASPAYTAEEMAYAMNVAKSKVILTVPSSIKVAVEAAERVGMPRQHVLLLEGEVDGFTSIQQLMERSGKYEVSPPHSIPDGQTNKNVCGYLNFSSGTTGLPKAVMLSHHNIIAQCYQLRQLQVSPERCKILAVMPLFHITGLVRFCHYPIFMNGDSIMLSAFTVESMCAAIVTYRVEELILVPPILMRLARDAIVEKYDLSHVRRWSSGAAPISPEIIRSLQQRFPWTGFRQGYGATESTACISCHPPSHYDYKYAATGGMLVANTVAKVVDLSTGEEVGPGKTGEILARGPQIAMGYLGNETATKETFDEDGFLHTGDVGNIDAEGLIHIEDRIKEMIKVKGLQVPPAELEDLLLGHEDVDDCAVVSTPDEYAGERPRAFVVLKRGRKADESMGKRLFEFVKERKVRYKWLVEVEFVDSVPKTPTGKLLRRVLKAREREAGRNGLRVRDDRREKAKL